MPRAEVELSLLGPPSAGRSLTAAARARVVPRQPPAALQFDGARFSSVSAMFVTAWRTRDSPAQEI